MKKLTVLLALSLSLTAHAGTSDIKKSVEKCMNENASTRGMDLCNVEGIDQAEKLLEKAIAETKKSVSDNKEILRRFQASQKIWKAFVNAQCKYEATDMLGGTGEALIEGSCRLDMTLQRVDSLNQSLGNN